MSAELRRLEEPRIMFGYDQAVEDPRDGLSLFGPLDEGKLYGVRAGVVGTADGIARLRRWVAGIQGPVASSKGERWERSHPSFPGFEAVFRIPWRPEPVTAIEVPAEEIGGTVFIDDAFQRVYRTVDVYAERIIQAIQEDETAVDIWYVVIPEIVYKYCRPKSAVESDLATSVELEYPVPYLKGLGAQPSLYEADNTASLPYQYELDFHNQLKARLLEYKVATQIVRETTIAHWDFLNAFGRPIRKLDGLEPDIAWHLATAAFYKTGGRPWKIAGIREAVCYIGLVFKRDHTSKDERSACCAAQMFLDSGDGLVFKGDVGPWYAPSTKEFHLDRQSAKELVQIALRSYAEKHGGRVPRELFLHGRVRFNYEEWAGFRDAVSSATNLVGVRIHESKDIKIFRVGRHPVLRGLTYVRDPRTAYLWTKGFTPRLATYPGREVPNPILIDVCKGEAPIETVLKDVLALTKVNYNACKFSDGIPVTLRFADQIGEILTAGPSHARTPHKPPPLQFKYYI